MSRSPVVKINSASLRHDSMVATNVAQHDRLCGPQGDAWAGCAQFFKADPRRELDALLTKIASYLRPEDRLLDVGGGGGRLSLPLALRCREVTNIDPSGAMREVFKSAASEAGITNTRFVQADWLDAEGVLGDVALAAHVTYFVPEIVPFIKKLNAATRRRVIVCARSVPPPNQVAPVFRLAHGEELAPVPGPNELLAVLIEFGIPAEQIDIGPAAQPATVPVAKTREDAMRIEVESAVRGGWLKEEETERLRRAIDQHFDEVLVETPEGYRRRSALDARDLLITWETA